jgi:hypothetical protein
MNRFIRIVAVSLLVVCTFVNSTPVGAAQIEKKTDAVISSIPGSNYSNNQINSFFIEKVSIHEDNILNYQEELKLLLKRIANRGQLMFFYLTNREE